MAVAVVHSETEADLAAIISTYNDVTEGLKRSHELLRDEVCRLRDELHEKNKELARRERLAALGGMAAGVAHEIRNPLGGIGLYTSVLERDLVDHPPQLDLVRKIRVGIRNLESIVGDILTFAGEARSDLCDRKLGGILDSVLTQIAPTVEERGITLVVDESLKIASVNCDAAQVERALLNLALNAIDAAGERGHIYFEEATEDHLRVDPAEMGMADPQGLDDRGGDASFLQIVVGDDGPGVDPDSIHRVFDPVYTTKHTGTGLGLAIVHRMAEANGGRVTVGRHRSGGAAFTLCLPLACEIMPVVATKGRS
jgi:signal transduction histidine kinase